MFVLILRKLLNNRWLTSCLVMGSLLAVGLISSIPMYTHGVLQRILTKDLERFQQSQGIFPGYYFIRADFPGGHAGSEGNSAYPSYNQKITSTLVPEIGLPFITSAHRLIMSYLTFVPEELWVENPKPRLALIDAMSDLDEHLKILRGRMFASEQRDGIYEVIVTDRAMQKQDLRLGEVYVISDTRNLLKKPLKVKIVGVFAPGDNEDAFWYRDMGDYVLSFFMDYDLFKKHFISTGSPLFSGAEWYYAFDYYKIRINDLNRIMRVLNKHTLEFKNLGIQHYKIAVLPLLEEYLDRERIMRSALSFLQFPVLLLLIFYIYMVSRFIIDSEKNEISVFGSRGASSRQVFLLYLLESFILAAAALAIGPFLGLAICSLIGSSNGFMEFVNRAALNLSPDGKTYLYALAGAFLFSAAMLMPALLASRSSVVVHKQEKFRLKGKVTWRKFYIDLLLLALAAYGYYTYSVRRKIVFITGLSGADMPVDPLLFIVSTLFILGLGLLTLRVFPFFIRLIFLLGRKIWSPGIFAAFIHVGRSSGRENFFMLFLILTLSVGTFASNAARTINWNMEERIDYTTGSDIVLKEDWVGRREDDPAPAVSELREPAFERYNNLPGVQSVTKVFRKLGVSLDAGDVHAQQGYLMAIIPDEFARTANFRSDLLPYHWYDYINLMMESPMAVLLSRSYNDYYGIQKGDTVYISWEGQDRVAGIVYAFIDYWPTCNPYGPPYGLDIGQGAADRHVISSSKGESHFIIANLHYIQARMTLEPYEVWLRLTPGSTGEGIYTALGEHGITLEALQDTRQDVLDLKNDPMLQGTNGSLTLGFITILLVCTIGFLIYSILSFRSRILQFGVFRAMGLSRKNVRNMIIFEQLLTTGTAILLGIVIGEITSYLFIPMLQIVFGGAWQAPPFRVVAFIDDYLRLYGVAGFSLVVCFIILGRLLAKTRIYEALKLGEE